MNKRYLLRRPGRPTVETPYGSVDDILHEKIPGQSVENPNLFGEAATNLIRKASGGREQLTDEAVARHLNIRDPSRIRRAREWLGLTDAEPAPRAPTEAERAAEFARFVDDDPPEAA